MASPTELTRIVINPVLVTRLTGVATVNRPLVRFMARRTRRLAMRTNGMLPAEIGVAALAIHNGLGLLVRLVAVAALELHRRVIGESNFTLSLLLVALKTRLPGRHQGRVLIVHLGVWAQEIVAFQAVHFVHFLDLYHPANVARAADRARRNKPVYGLGVTLGALEVLLSDVNLVTGRVSYLLPLGITAFVALLANFRRNIRVFGDVVGTIDGILHHLLHTRGDALLVAFMTADGPMFARLPAIPRRGHGVTAPAKSGVVLGVTVDLGHPIDSTSGHHHEDGQNANLHTPREMVDCPGECLEFG